jgi:catechol-2,3-dioxygenase
VGAAHRLQGRLSLEELEATKARLQAAGIEVVGPTDHTIFKSIYFFDPNGHRSNWPPTPPRPR